MIYKASLGLYNFQLAIAVARNSQMDPKSYFPEIRNYQQTYDTNPDRAKYEIDVMLERFLRAL